MLFFGVAFAFMVGLVKGSMEPLTANAFNKLLGNKGVLVKFYAPWCGHCQTLEPIWERLATTLKDADDLAIVRVDATVEKELAQQYKVMSYPTIMWFSAFHEDPAKIAEFVPFNDDRTFEKLLSFVNMNGIMHRCEHGDVHGINELDARAAMTKCEACDRAACAMKILDNWETAGPFPVESAIYKKLFPYYQKSLDKFLDKESYLMDEMTRLLGIDMTAASKDLSDFLKARFSVLKFLNMVLDACVKGETLAPQAVMTVHHPEAATKTEDSAAKTEDAAEL